MRSAIEEVIGPRATDLGGFQVRRLLPSHPRKLIGPFIFWDHMGPAAFQPGQGVDVRPHPHIGLATVTYLFEGAILHRDSLGSVQLIRPGDVNWMTAGRGIVHSERTPAELRDSESRVHGLQTWVALPLAHEEAEPSFFHHPAATLPSFEASRGVNLRVIAGHAFGLRSPVNTSSDMLYVAVEMGPNTSLLVPAEHEERAVYIVAGEATVLDQPIPPQNIAVLAANHPVEMRARSAATLMLLGGAKTDGDRLIWWNFVSSSRERIEDAKQAWREGRFGSVPGETEFIPLPAR